MTNLLNKKVNINSFFWDFYDENSYFWTIVEFVPPTLFDSAKYIVKHDITWELEICSIHRILILSEQKYLQKNKEYLKNEWHSQNPLIKNNF